MSDEIIIKLDGLLKSLRSEVPGTKGSLLLNDDGFIIVSDMGEESDHYEIGKLFCSFEAIGAKFTEKIFNSQGIRFSIWNDKGDIQFFPVDKTFLLVIISDYNSRPGLLLLRVAKIIEILRELLESENL